MSVNRRKYPRVSIHVPVNYALLGSQRKIESEFIGVALDVSLGGILLESFDFVSTEYVDISFIDMENNLAQMTCKMAYSRKTDFELIHTGLSFQGSETEKSDFAAKMIRAYFYRRKRIFDPNLVSASGGEPVREPLNLT
jgi:c-di-GMP-binding flagellar brake protein YcgR